MQVEHIVARANGGTNRVSNLTLSCEPCNLAKGTRDINVFLSKKPEVLKRILTQAKTPLKDASAVNSTRWALYARLKATGLPVECGSGGLTKFNRTTRCLPKDHWIDAVCVGESTPEQIKIDHVHPLLIRASSHGIRQMCQTDIHGFPIRYRQRKKRYFGFQTGDMVRATLPKGKFAGIYVGRVTVRASGSFKMKTPSGEIAFSHKHCQMLQRHDGYEYRTMRSPQSV